jgi:antitoxin component of MazEF toxin-antitoxin module
MQSKTYKVEDIFKEIPDDPNNIIMQIPPDICEKQGWVEGTKLKIEVSDQGTMIITEVDKKGVE